MIIVLMGQHDACGRYALHCVPPVNNSNYLYSDYVTNSLTDDAHCIQPVIADLYSVKSILRYCMTCVS